MGFLDKIKSLVGKNADKVEDGLDQAADFAKDQISDEHDDKVDLAVDQAKNLVGSRDEDEESSND